MPTEKENCPLCGALPCDWCDDPHQTQDALFMALASLRIKAGLGERPMLTEVPDLIAERLHKAKMVLSALADLQDDEPARTVFGADLSEWRHRARLWLLNEPEPQRKAAEWFCTGCGQTDPSKRCLGCRA
jgi:hypothetical protein